MSSVLFLDKHAFMLYNLTSKIYLYGYVDNNCAGKT
jgi:hypothetical protein